MESKKFTNYDVLLVLSPSDTTTTNNLSKKEDYNWRPNQKFTVHFAVSDHIGNNRFTVLLNLHRDSYKQAIDSDDEDKCHGIIQTLVDAICDKCVGRLLEKTKTSSKNGSEYFYRDLGDGKEARDILRAALLQSTIDVYNAIDDEPKAAREEQYLDTDLIHHRSSKRLSTAIDDFTKKYFVGIMIGSLNDGDDEDNANKNNSKNETSNNDDDWKKSVKRRRSSRLSVLLLSDMAGNMLNPKVSRCKRGFRRFSSLFRPAIATIEVTNYDVFCAFERDENGVHPILPPASTSGPPSIAAASSNQPKLTHTTDHVGNARISIMVDLQREKYKEAVACQNYSEQTKIIDDIIGTHKDSCLGRFLVQNAETGFYHELSRERAMASVEDLLFSSSSSPLSSSSSSKGKIHAQSSGSNTTNLSLQPIPCPSKESSFHSAAIQTLLRRKQVKDIFDHQQQEREQHQTQH